MIHALGGIREVEKMEMDNNEKIATATENMERKTENTEHKKVETEQIKKGVVSNCLSLAVRKTPSIKSEIIHVLKYGSEVAIGEKESTDKFYKVSTMSGIEGYCAKEFIEL
jgi:uncharacterized protein YgiM (DUF1202 family)